MNTSTLTAGRAGLHRGWIEYRQTFTSGQDLFGYFGTALIFLVVVSIIPDGEFEDTGVTTSAIMLASIGGFLLVMGGLMSVAQVLGSEREDGTLLRAKALPRGMFGYLVGKTVHITLITATSLAVLFLGGTLLIDGVAIHGAGALLTFVWVLVLGLLATAPFGAIIGSLITNPRTTPGLLMIPIMGIAMISGIFFPSALLPQWVQDLSQVFPVYWLGLGMRSAFLPDSMLSGEIAESWRHLETAGVLGAWAVVGLLIAPVVLRRMARRESGSRVEAARQKAMQRAI